MNVDGGVAPRGRDRAWTIALVALFLLSLGLRAVDTDAMVNVDMFHLWSKRIARFIAAVGAHDFASTYQSHHPGVTFMWLAGLAWKARGIVDAPLDPEKLRLAVLPIVVIGSFFPPVVSALLDRALARRHRAVALLTGLLFATEPMFVAHSRNAHLDMLVTAFAWCAVLAALIAKRSGAVRWAVTSGVLLGLALATKLSSAGIAIGIAVVFVWPSLRSGLLATATAITDPASRRNLNLLGLIAALAALVLFACWPALWVAPVDTLGKLWLGVHREAGKASEFMLFGQTGRLTLPRWVYGVFLVFLVTPELWITGIALLLIRRRATPVLRDLAMDVAFAALPLLVLLVGSSRVGNRYLIPVLPALGILSAIALTELSVLLRPRLGPSWRASITVAALLLVIGRTWRVSALHPLPITYCSGWTGVDCANAFHLGWGEGLKEAAALVAQASNQRGYAEPTKLFGSGYASTMRVWTPVAAVRSIDDAQILVDYLSDRQRHLASAIAIEQYVKQRSLAPLGEVVLHGRAYVRLFPGPRY